MGIAKKGSRDITVCDTTYRWTVSAQDMEGLGLFVEEADTSGLLHRSGAELSRSDGKG